MTLTASELRQNIYRLLDEVLDSGVPLEVERKGRRLRIVPAERIDKLSRIEGHADYIRGDPDDVVHVDWSDEWRP